MSDTDHKKAEFKVIKGGLRHSDDKCDCIICKCVCPECGGKNIEVIFHPGYRLGRGSGDRVVIGSMPGSIEFECDDCNKTILIEEYDAKTTPKLAPLAGFFYVALELPFSALIEHDEDGEIIIRRGY